MAEFISDLTFVFELFAIAGGLVLLDRAAASGGGYTKLAGWLLVVGGIGTALCTGYYWLKYNDQGDFDRAYPPHMMQDMGMMGGGMMQMMHDRKKGMGMRGGMMDKQDCPKGVGPKDCPRTGMMMQDGQTSRQSGGMQPHQRMMQEDESVKE